MRADTMADRTSQPLIGRLLVLDAPAHGRASPPWEEAVLNIARYTAGMLEAQGASILVTTGTQAPASVAGRARQIEQHGAEVVLFLRTGSHPSTQIRGVRAVVPSPYALSSRRLAERLLKRICARTGLPSRGVPLWSWFPPDLAAMVRGHRAVSLVVECATPTCPADELLLMRRSFQMRVAHGLTEGILDYFGLLADEAAVRLEDAVPLEDEPGLPDVAQLGDGRDVHVVTGVGDRATAEAGGESNDGMTTDPVGEPEDVVTARAAGEPDGAAPADGVEVSDGALATDGADRADAGAAAGGVTGTDESGGAPPGAPALVDVPPVVVTARPPGKPTGGPPVDSAPGQFGRASAAFPGSRPAQPAAQAQPQRTRPAREKKIIGVWPSDPNKPAQRTVTPAWQQPSSPIAVPPFQGPPPPIGFVETGQGPARGAPPEMPPVTPSGTPAPSQGMQPPPGHMSPPAPPPGQGQGTAQLPFFGAPGQPEPMVVMPDGSFVSPRAQILMRLQTRSAAQQEKKGAESPPES